jgi:hypothetical protein
MITTEQSSEVRVKRNLQTWLWALCGWAVHAIVFGSLYYVLVTIVPTFERMYQEFEIGLPQVTRLVFSASHLASRLWWLVAILIVPANGTLWDFLLTHQRRWAWAWLFLPLMVACGAAGVIGVAILLPQLGLMHSLSQ